MKRKIIIVFLLLVVMSIIVDVSYRGNINEGYIDRDTIGGEEKELKLQLDVDGVIEDYEYSIKISPELPSEELAEEYFQEALSQIDKEFTDIESIVPLRGKYVNGVVSAEWSFRPYGLVNESGEIAFNKIGDEEIIVQAQVELQCGTYEKIYTFPFEIKAPTPSRKERMLQKIDEWIELQTKTEGSQKLQLPSEVDGEKVLWFEKREFITPQVLVLELVALLLLKIISKRKCEEEKKQYLMKLEADYPDIVNQLSLLISAGMTTRQAWSRIATQYVYKRKEGLVPEKRVYEAIVQMSHRFKEGESERVVYQQFIEEVPAPCYRKLIRLLLSSLEKGTSGIAFRLEDECRLAFEQKIFRAKKLGEEASTKMLLPLMIMLFLVMGVVMLPALMKFQI